MQSPQKLHDRLNELLAPPAHDADAPELTLHTLVRVAAPYVSGLLAQYDAQTLDEGLEHVALFFLSVRSDGEPPTLQFLERLGELLEPGAQPTPQIPAGGSTGQESHLAPEIGGLGTAVQPEEPGGIEESAALPETGAGVLQETPEQAQGQPSVNTGSSQPPGPPWAR